MADYRERNFGFFFSLILYNLLRIISHEMKDRNDVDHFVRSYQNYHRRSNKLSDMVMSYPFIYVSGSNRTILTSGHYPLTLDKSHPR